MTRRDKQKRKGSRLNAAKVRHETQRHKT